MHDKHNGIYDYDIVYNFGVIKEALDIIVLWVDF